MTILGHLNKICRIVYQRILFFPAPTIVFLSLILGPISSFGAPTKTSPQAEKCSAIFPNFLTPEVAHFSMIGDFQKAKKLSGGGNWTGEERPWNQFGVPVTIAFFSGDGGHIETSTEALMRVRGMSSAEESKFPKLKVKLPDNFSEGNSLFDGFKSFRINTSGYNNDPLAPFREALAYELAEVLGMPTPKIRRAMINYKQKNEDGSLTDIEEHQALLIENDKPMLKRLGVQDVSKDFLENHVQVDTDKACLYFTYHALIANEDIGLRVRKEPTMGTDRYRPLFNTVVLKANSSSFAEPLVYDLDKSAIVGLNGYNEIKMSALMDRNMSGQEARMFFNLSRLRQRFTADEIDRALQKVLRSFPSMKALVQSREQSNLIDKKAAQQIYQQFDWFEQFSVKFRDIKITLKETAIYQQPKADKELSLLPLSFTDEVIPLRPGTPLKVLGQSSDGKFLKVVMVDTHYEVRSDMPQQLIAGIGEYIGYIDVNSPIGNELAVEDLGYTNELDMAQH